MSENTIINRLPVIVAVCSAFVTITAQAQLHSLSRSDDSITIAIMDARPVAAALQLISAEFPLEMTYEDPRYVYEGDLEDVTLEVRRDLALYDDPSQAPRVIVPRRSQALSAVIAISREPTSEADWMPAIDSVVQAQNELWSGGQFRVEESPGAVHIIPTAARNEAGQFVSQTPILSTRITIPPQELNGLSMISAICEAVSVAAGGTFSYDNSTILQSLLKILRVPTGVLRRHRGVLAADDEPARDVLLRVLREVDEKRAWLVFVTFDPILDNYWLNVRSSPRTDQISSPSAPPPVGEQEDGPAGGFLMPPELLDEVVRRESE